MCFTRRKTRSQKSWVLFSVCLARPGEYFFCDISSRTPATAARRPKRNIFPQRHCLEARKPDKSSHKSRAEWGTREASEERSEKVKRNENGRNKNICSIADDETPTESIINAKPHSPQATKRSSRNKLKLLTVQGFQCGFGLLLSRNWIPRLWSLARWSSWGYTGQCLNEPAQASPGARPFIKNPTHGATRA